MHVYSEMSSIVINGAYSQKKNVYLIAIIIKLIGIFYKLLKPTWPIKIYDQLLSLK